MKSFLQLFIVMLFVASKSFAIPTLTQANTAPAIGDVNVLNYADTMSGPGPSGPMQSWVFNLAITSNWASSTGVDPATTTNGPSFPFSNVALESTGGAAYEYLLCSSTGIVQLGAAQGVQVVSYGSGIDFLTFPFTYNDVVSTPSYNGNFTQGTLVGSNSMTADGYGSLTINGQVYPDVLRLHQVQSNTYTYTGIGNLVYNLESYIWYDGIHKTSIMQMVIIDVSGFQTSHSKQLSVADFATGIKNVNSSVSLLNLFPNPAQTETKISMSLDRASEVVLKVYNSNGAQVFVKDLGQLSPCILTESLDLTAYTRGIYMIDIVTDGISNTKRLIVY